MMPKTVAGSPRTAPRNVKPAPAPGKPDGRQNRGGAAAKSSVKMATSPAKAMQGTTAKSVAKTLVTPGSRTPASKTAAPKPTRAKTTLTKRAATPQNGIAYLNGDIVPLEQATVSLNDRGFLLGDGVFETLRASNGRLYRLDDHAARMAKGLAAVNLDRDLVHEFRHAATELTKAGLKAFGGELYVRIMVTTGPMEDVLGTGRGYSVYGLAKKFKPYPMQFYSHGIDVVLSKQRKDSRSPLSAVKTLSFLPYIAARREAHQATVHDALLLNEADRIAEASTSNIFALHENTIYAPGEDEGAIAGVTRAAVLELLEGRGLRIRERLTTTTLHNAEEAWLTNTTGGIVPIRSFQDKPVGQAGARGKLTAELSRLLEAQIRGGQG